MKQFLSFFLPLCFLAMSLTDCQAQTREQVLFVDDVFDMVDAQSYEQVTVQVDGPVINVFGADGEAHQSFDVSYASMIAKEPAGDFTLNYTFLQYDGSDLHLRWHKGFLIYLELHRPDNSKEPDWFLEPKCDGPWRSLEMPPVKSDAPDRH